MRGFFMPIEIGEFWESVLNDWIQGYTESGFEAMEWEQFSRDLELT